MHRGHNVAPAGAGPAWTDVDARVSARRSLFPHVSPSIRTSFRLWESTKMKSVTWLFTVWFLAVVAIAESDVRVAVESGDEVAFPLTARWL